MVEGPLVLKLFLFDVDGTLILTGGAGIRALGLAFADLYGVEKGTEGVDVAGRIDTAIFRAALAKNGLPDDDFDAQLARFRDAYCRHLEHTLPEATGGRVLPGVRELLTALHGREDVRLSLTTGNFRRGAELKLSYYGLWQFFDDGAFAEDTEDRSELVAIAKRRLLDESEGGRASSTSSATRRTTWRRRGRTARWRWRWHRASAASSSCGRQAPTSCSPTSPTGGACSPRWASAPSVRRRARKRLDGGSEGP